MIKEARRIPSALIFLCQATTYHSRYCNRPAKVRLDGKHYCAQHGGTVALEHVLGER